MAKRKIGTKKEKEVKELFSDKDKARQGGIKGMVLTEGVVPEGFESEVEELFSNSIEPVEPDVVEKVSKEDLQDQYDQEVKDLLKEMGNIQSRYQQLGRTNKAKSLRNQKRIIQGLYKEWK